MPEVVIVLVALFLNANLGSNMRVPEQINYSGLNCEHSIFFRLFHFFFPGTVTLSEEFEEKYSQRALAVQMGQLIYLFLITPISMAFHVVRFYRLIYKQPQDTELETRV